MLKAPILVCQLLTVNNEACFFVQQPEKVKVLHKLRRFGAKRPYPHHYQLGSLARH